MITVLPDAASDARTQSVARTACAGIAEHLRLLLLAQDIRAAVVNGDPLRVGAALCEVIVLATDQRKASSLIQSAADVANPYQADWSCEKCRETVPAHFEVCWNCGEDRHTPTVGGALSAAPEIAEAETRR